MHVDGFRFDLASTLGRESTGFEREGGFFAAIRQDPILNCVKLIAEPWDVGAGGYQVGGFPWPFREWNDKFRDDSRGFWRKDGKIPEMSERLLGSPVQFNHSHRPATSSVNFLAAHDGFTLWDTVSFNDKHNEANGEGNRDGHSNNLSDNMGVEGATKDKAVIASRERRAKAMLATLLLSQGVPMMLAGDEMGQTQNGNNNAYAQDNETTWIDWSSPRESLLSAVRDLAAFRKEARLARLRFATAPGEEVRGDGPAVRWLHPAGREMTTEDWQDGGLRLFGADLTLPGGPRLLLLLNAGDAATFEMPEGSWMLRIDTARDRVGCEEPAGPETAIDWQSVQVFLFDGELDEVRTARAPSEPGGRPHGGRGRPPAARPPGPPRRRRRRALPPARSRGAPWPRGGARARACGRRSPRPSRGRRSARPPPRAGTPSPPRLRPRGGGGPCRPTGARKTPGPGSTPPRAAGPPRPSAAPTAPRGCPAAAPIRRVPTGRRARHRHPAQRVVGVEDHEADVSRERAHAASSALRRSWA
jgi:hypothetical protein